MRKQAWGKEIYLTIMETSLRVCLPVCRNSQFSSLLHKLYKSSGRKSDPEIVFTLTGDILLWLDKAFHFLVIQIPHMLNGVKGSLCTFLQNVLKQIYFETFKRKRKENP